MTCIFCRTGKTHPGTTTLTLQENGTILVIEHVPAEVCDNCGEAYVDGATAKRLSEQADAAHREGVHVVIREFAPIAA